MSKKTIKVLLIIFLVLLVVSVMPFLKSALNKKSTSPFVDFMTLTEKAVTKIVIKQGGDERTLTKEGDTWKINTYPASKKQVQDFFDALKNTTLNSQVSKNPQNQNQFGVTSENGYTLTFTANGKDTTFIFGNSASTPNSVYVKKNDTDAVYLLTSGVRDFLLGGVNSWRNKTIVDVLPDQQITIVIGSPNEPLTLTRNSNKKWEAKGGSKTANLDEETAQKLTARLNPLEATDFLTEEQTGEYKKASGKTALQIKDTTDKISAEIELLKKDANWWAKKSNDDIYYSIPDANMKEVLLNYSQIFK